jgi:LmbE family N-acetylglucosaminyl deacetylase
MNWQPKRVLALSAHTDDVEFSAGGFISQLIENEIEIRSVVFSIARESVPKGFDEDVLSVEVRAAHKVLGVPPNALIVFDYPVRHFPQHRQEILEELIRQRQDFAPDMVLVHSSTDVHQDHHTLYQEAVRAFKHTTILGYQVPWNNLVTNQQMHIALSKQHLARKIEAIQTYKSQAGRTYSSPEFLRSWACTVGIMINVLYAETFEVIHWVVSI